MGTKRLRKGLGGEQKGQEGISAQRMRPWALAGARLRLRSQPQPAALSVSIRTVPATFISSSSVHPGH